MLPPSLFLTQIFYWQKKYESELCPDNRMIQTATHRIRIIVLFITDCTDISKNSPLDNQNSKDTNNHLGIIHIDLKWKWKVCCLSCLTSIIITDLWKASNISRNSSLLIWDWKQKSLSVISKAYQMLQYALKEQWITEWWTGFQIPH